MRIIAVVSVFVLVIIAISLWQVGSALDKQACVAKAVGQYPGVPVSAYTGKATGALKLSFINERLKALNSC